MGRPGRPPKLNAAVQKALCDAIRFGQSIRGACGIAGISHVAFYRWIHKGAEDPNGLHGRFVAALEKARGEFEREQISNIKAAIEDKTRGWTPAAWLLERRLHEEWARRDAPDQDRAPKRDVVLRIGVEQAKQSAAEPEGEGGASTDAIGFVFEQSDDGEDDE